MILSGKEYVRRGSTAEKKDIQRAPRSQAQSSGSEEAEPGSLPTVP